MVAIGAALVRGSNHGFKAVQAITGLGSAVEPGCDSWRSR